MTVQLHRRVRVARLPLFSEPIITYSGHPLKLSEIKEGCRWVISHKRGDTETLCCGAPTLPGEQWCRDHHHRVFVTVPTEAA